LQFSKYLNILNFYSSENRVKNYQSDNIVSISRVNSEIAQKNAIPAHIQQANKHASKELIKPS
jgi:hypothetical protein